MHIDILFSMNSLTITRQHLLIITVAMTYKSSFHNSRPFSAPDGFTKEPLTLKSK